MLYLKYACDKYNFVVQSFWKEKPKMPYLKTLLLFLFKAVDNENDKTKDNIFSVVLLHFLALVKFFILMCEPFTEQ